MLVTNQLGFKGLKKQMNDIDYLCWIDGTCWEGIQRSQVCVPTNQSLLGLRTVMNTAYNFRPHK